MSREPVDDKESGVSRSVLDFMRGRAGIGQISPAEAADRGGDVLPPSFADMPGYKRAQAQVEAARQLGLANPFYRAHQRSAGSTTQIDGRVVSNFGSYDYLGLNGHPDVVAGAHAALDVHGISASASRLVAGERPVHRELETAIARTCGVEDAVVFVSGYLTNTTTLATLLRPQDLVLHDEFAHNSILAGIRLSGASRRSFRHNDLADLERLLSGARQGDRRVLVVVEGLYSMDGDVADLPALLALRRKHGFWLMVDEAHALGVLGRTGRGSAEHFGCDPNDVDIWMGTLSKTTASCGGYVAGSRALTTILKAHAGGFIYSVGLAPVLAAAALASLSVLEREPERVARLQANGRRFLETARAAGLETGPSSGLAVIPVMVGDSLRAVRLSADLLDLGVNVLPIIHPAVPEGMARLRFFITSEHTPEQIDHAVAVTARCLAGLAESGFGIASLDLSKLMPLLAED